MKCVKIPIKKAQQIKEYLIKNRLLNNDYAFLKDKDYFYFPLKINISVKKIKSYSITNKKLKKKDKQKSLKETLKKKLTKKELEKLKKSYDVVGTIAILEIDDELKRKEKIIAKILLKLRKNVKTVLRKVNGRKGTFRLQEYKFITGEKKFETLYKENNIRLKVNLKNMYFSPRLSNERKRIASLVKKNEDVLVMFSGCAPFPVVIAKNSKAKEIYGVEINPEAHSYGEENIKLNKIKNIKLFCGDVKKIVPKLNKFNRIVMPFPGEGLHYLDIAVKASKKNATIHFYSFLDEKDIPKKAYNEIKKICNELNKNYKILRHVKVGQFSPRKYRVCVDFKIT